MLKNAKDVLPGLGGGIGGVGEGTFLRQCSFISPFSSFGLIIAEGEKNNNRLPVISPRLLSLCWNKVYVCIYAILFAVKL